MSDISISRPNFLSTYLPRNVLVQAYREARGTLDFGPTTGHRAIMVSFEHVLEFWPIPEVL
jgi:hypothetical protein